MQHSKRNMIEGSFAAVLAMILLSAIVRHANGQDAPAPPPHPDDHPAFLQLQKMTITVEPYVPDVPKLEQRLVDILRAADPTLTLAAAREKLRIDGKTDVARCLELLMIYVIDQPVQFDAVSITVASQHPEPTP